MTPDIRTTALAAVELASKATKGRWFWNHVGDDLNVDAEHGPPYYGTRGILSAAGGYDGDSLYADGSLCAHAGNHHGTLGAEVLRLLDENERLREALKRAREDARHYGVRAITQSITASGCEEARDRVNTTLTVIDAALHPAGAKERQT